MANVDWVEPNGWDVLALVLLLVIATASFRAWVRLIGCWRRRKPLTPPDWRPEELPTPGRRLWPGSTLALVAGAYVLVQLGVAAGFRDLIAGATRGAGDPMIVLWLTAIINLLTIVLVPLVIRATAPISLDDLGLARSSDWVRDARTAIWLLLVLLPLIYGVMALLTRFITPREHPVLETIRGDGSSPGTIWLTFVSAVLAAPVAEELLFRGVLLGWLTSLALEGEARRGTWTHGRPAPPRALWIPNLVASWLFAALHTPQWPAPIPLFLLSLGLGWLAQRSGRLGGPILAHMAFNGLSTLMLLIASQSAAARTAPVPGRPPAVGVEAGLVRPIRVLVPAA
jgi:membrane protease YdiL (CAAX protease family)